MATYLQNCTIVDGTGAPAYPGGILIRDGRIADITDSAPDLPNLEIIDCTGLVAAPGFIDAHSHNDWFVLDGDAEQHFRPFLQQGITTFVVGNCGFSASGYSADSPYAEQMGGGIFEQDGEGRRATEFAKWLEAVNARALANIAPLIGHGTVRTGINGKGAGALTREQRRQMMERLEAALQQGALGVSLGLMYEPGLYASRDEILEVARLVKRYDRILTVHPKAESTVSLSYPLWKGSHLLLALQELADIVRETGVRLQYSHLIFVGKRTWRDEAAALEIFEDLQDEGHDIMFDMYPLNYGASVITVVLPEWYMRLSPKQRLAPLTRLKLWAMVKVTVALLGFGFPDITISYAGEEHPDWIGKTIPELAKMWGIGDFSAYLRACEESGFDAKVLQGAYQNVDIMRRLMQHPQSLYMTDAWVQKQGKQNGGVYGAFPMFLEQAAQVGFPIEQAVAKMTGLTARRFQLKDRGEIRRGAYADITVLDRARLKSRIDEALPPLGVEHVFVNGQHVVRSGIYQAKAGVGAVVRHADGAGR